MAVNISSYDAFKNEVLGKSYDPDGVYGAQCVDGANILWIALGRWIDCGGDNARGIWTRRKEKNAGTDFDLIYRAEDLRRGDVIVWSTGQYGHIGYVDGIGSGYVTCLGQNQKGSGSGYPFTLVNLSLNGFAGAFRLRRWSGGTTPAAASTTSTSIIKAGDTVKVTNLVDYNGTKLLSLQPTYVVSEVSGNRAVLTFKIDGSVYAAVNTANLELVQEESSKPAETTKTTLEPEVKKPKFEVGDMVRPLRKVDYDGRKLRQYDDSYIITSLEGNRAVLSARGVIWAAMNIDDIEKV